MMNISPMVNSVKCTVFSRFVQFSHGLEGSTAYVKSYAKGEKIDFPPIILN